VSLRKRAAPVGESAALVQDGSPTRFCPFRRSLSGKPLASPLEPSYGWVSKRPSHPTASPPRLRAARPTRALVRASAGVQHHFRAALSDSLVVEQESEKERRLGAEPRR